jgi:hypothetical protein
MKLPKCIAYSCLALGLVTAFQAKAVQVNVDPASPWVGYMNVFNLPADGGAYMFGSVWGTADLRAAFSGNVVTLAPNTNTYNPADPYWVKPNGDGNKSMDASFYVQNDSLAGQSVNFIGNVIENSLIAPYTSVAFIKDFAPDYSSSTSVTVPLTSGSFFSLTMATTAGHHIQYGFETIGPDANPNTAAALGIVTVIPEPSSLALLCLAGGAFLAYRRR